MVQEKNRRKTLIDRINQKLKLADRQRLIYLTKAKPGDGCASSCEPFQFIEEAQHG